jgi:hypothetical protein
MSVLLLVDAQNDTRLISVREAADTHSFLARVIESLVLYYEKPRFTG